MGDLENREQKFEWPSERKSGENWRKPCPPPLPALWGFGQSNWLGLGLGPRQVRCRHLGGLDATKYVRQREEPPERDADPGNLQYQSLPKALSSISIEVSTGRLSGKPSAKLPTLIRICRDWWCLLLSHLIGFVEQQNRYAGQMSGVVLRT